MWRNHDEKKQSLLFWIMSGIIVYLLLSKSSKCPKHHPPTIKCPVCPPSTSCPLSLPPPACPVTECPACQETMCPTAAMICPTPQPCPSPPPCPACPTATAQDTTQTSNSTSATFGSLGRSLEF